MLIEAMEKSFGAVEALSGGRRHAEIPRGQPRRLHRVRNRAHCRVTGSNADQHAGVHSQSNGMTERLVSTFRRTYVSRMDITDTRPRR